ncbi:carbon storage regulator [Virgibacillus halodenitrificans]|uniref:Carbon storage regulator n=1 Tax=Virgibacillus halodenitrificans TaxID=1482 RepID=A0ABR7VH76_VIRHA|nr:carbon storage regulator [Virgibacillus halodenitrificans]MBD1221292.1 carbon storage regulator [Virgibacillus halodenitrificans]
MGLILGRKPGEKLHIIDAQGREIEIEVVKREDEFGNFTQLRINASRVLQIVRGEIHKDSNSN